MALVPKTVSSGPTVPTSGPRPAAGARVATYGGAPIEESSIGTAAFFDPTAFEYTDTYPQAGNDHEGGRRNKPYQRNHLGTINAASQEFASLMELGAKGRVVDEHGNVHMEVFASIVSKAIQTYEINTQIIAGTLGVRGTSLSISL